MVDTRLSYIIDPGGIAGIRPGINLRVFPSGNQPHTAVYTPDVRSRTANSNLVIGEYNDLQDFETTFSLTGTDFAKMMSLDTYTKRRFNQRLNSEIVVYNLVQPYSEIAATRTRFKVPATDVIESVSLGSGLFRLTYWVAIQGTFQWSYVQKGSIYECQFKFQEGTQLTASMES